MRLLLRSGLHLANVPYRPDWWSAAETVFLREGSPLSTEQCCSFVRPSCSQSSPWLLSCGRLRTVLVIPNFSHLMEATVLIGTFSAAQMFLFPSPGLCHATMMSQRCSDNFLNFMALFVMWHVFYGACVCVFPNHCEWTEFTTGWLQSSWHVQINPRLFMVWLGQGEATRGLKCPCPACFRCVFNLTQLI